MCKQILLLLSFILWYSVKLEIGSFHYLLLHRKEEILGLKVCNGEWLIIKTFHTKKSVVSIYHFIVAIFFIISLLNLTPFISSPSFYSCKFRFRFEKAPNASKFCPVEYLKVMAQ